MRAFRHLAGIAGILFCFALWLVFHALIGGSLEVARAVSAFVIVGGILASLGVAADEQISYRSGEDDL